MLDKNFENNKDADQMFVIKKGKKKSRDELMLPPLYFVSMTDWEKKLGSDTLINWLKLLTLVDRTEEALDKYGNKSTIPRSLRKLMVEFGLSKATFYRKVIRPLWEYGFIDVITWNGSSNDGHKPKNIMVYEYPQNEFHLAVKPLQKIRDYDRDYNSVQAIFGRKGANKRKETDMNKSSKRTYQGNGEEEHNNDGLKNETTMVSEIEPPLVSKMKPINYTNNNLTEEEEINNIINARSHENRSDQNNQIKNQVKSIVAENFIFEFLGDFLYEKGVNPETINKTILAVFNEGIDLFRMEDIEGQYQFMMDKLHTRSVDNHRNFAVYFANGLKDRTEQSIMKDQYEKERQRQYELHQQQLQKKRENKMKHPSYNWLEEE
ncbi:hypothetical protein [Evansella halocellulosilytica]|uniref:hypothetical protein n=1 Tax=Evansella halocellulosilytica TaxID=2011013 RepID=UPI000BB74D64|nr:hypothetical protein [Evansella halocellulosilytica]